MNAPTAKQDPTTPKTSGIATATPAASTTTLRIDEFIKSQFEKAQSESFSGVKHSASRLAQLGFRSSANCRYADFLEAFQSTPALSAHYAERYPNCCFLPWMAFHAVLKSLDLWCDSPEFYAGAVPDEQIPWIEIFELNPEDAVWLEDLYALLKLTPSQQNEDLLLYAWRGDGSRTRVGSMSSAMRYHMTIQMLKAGSQQFRESLFVVAPKEAFTSKADFITRLRTGVAALPEPTVAPNDPLVVRFVNGGALVIAAWGDEAAYLNQAVRDLNL